MLQHCVSQLSEDQVWHRPTSHQNAIGNLLLHLQGNLQQWIVCGLSGQETSCCICRATFSSGSSVD